MLLQPSKEIPALQPLARSHERNDFEAQFKALTMSLFEDFIRPVERRINVLGAPHLGDFELLERNIKRDGLALYRGADEGSMRYLYKAWRARNPRRGLALLKLYLQLLFPNNWSVHQQWQDKDLPYPTALSNTDGGNHWLTSRVHVQIGVVPDITAVLSLVSAIRSVLPVRFVLIVSVQASDTGLGTMGMAVGGSGILSGNFSGTIG